MKRLRTLNFNKQFFEIISLKQTAVVDLTKAYSIQQYFKTVLVQQFYYEADLLWPDVPFKVSTEYNVYLIQWKKAIDHNL